MFGLIMAPSDLGRIYRGGRSHRGRHAGLYSGRCFVGNTQPCKCRPHGANELSVDVDTLYDLLLRLRLRHVREVATIRTPVRGCGGVDPQPGLQFIMVALLPIRTGRVALEIPDILREAADENRAADTPVA